MIEFEVWIMSFTILVEPPVEEQKLTEAGPFDAFEELFRDDLVGIDVCPIHCGDDAGMRSKALHGDYRIEKIEQDQHSLLIVLQLSIAGAVALATVRMETFKQRRKLTKIHQPAYVRLFESAMSPLT